MTIPTYYIVVDSSIKLSHSSRLCNVSTVASLSYSIVVVVVGTSSFYAEIFATRRSIYIDG
jgi:hypothetical protein